MKVLIAIAIFAIFTAATATLPSPSPEGASASAVIRPTESSRPQVADTRTKKCIRSSARLKSTIADRRLATWRWQDELAVPHTRTAFRERAALGCAYLRWIRSRWTLRADEAFRSWVELRDPQVAICHVFGTYCSEAISVASCESGRTFDTKAENGQYLGIFQMGSHERATYGHGRSALAQSRAAYAYFAASGRDWSPWSCKP